MVTTPTQTLSEFPISFLSLHSVELFSIGGYLRAQRTRDV